MSEQSTTTIIIYFFELKFLQYYCMVCWERRPEVYNTLAATETYHAIQRKLFPLWL